MAGQLKVDSINADSNLALKIANTAVAFIDSNGLRPTSGNVSLDSTGTTGVRLPTANTLAFHTAGTEDMRLDTNGNLFLGATSSALNSTKLLSYATADQSGITVNATNASQTSDVVLIRNTRNTTNGSYNALTVYNDGASAYRFQLTDGGNIGLFGGQIKFPVTQSASSDANTLDDYEEGTWTPSVGGNATYVQQYGVYVKVGRMVYAGFDININVIGTGSTSTLSGFPFTTTGAGFPYTGSTSYWAALTTNLVYLGFYMQNASTTALFVGNSATSGTTIQYNSFGVLGNSARIVGSVVYESAS
jgi:hypothetical protein